MSLPSNFVVYAFLTIYALKRGEKSFGVTKRSSVSGMCCADKAYKMLCIIEENKAQKKVLLGKIKAEIKK